MAIYLSWGLFTYISWAILWLLLMHLTCKAVNKTDIKKSTKRWLVALITVCVIYLLQFPWHYSSTSNQSYRLTFDKSPRYDVEMIERDIAEESWEDRSKRQLVEARKAADERTDKALSELIEEGEK